MNKSSYHFLDNATLPPSSNMLSSCVISDILIHYTFKTPQGITVAVAVVSIHLQFTPMFIVSTVFHSFLHLPGYIWVYIPSACRTPFSISFGAGQLVVRFIKYCFSESIFIPCLFLKDTWASIDFHLVLTLFQGFEDITSLSSGSHCFTWEVSCQSFGGGN